MPTGYTDIIGSGATFEEFARHCAKGMGALIHMRDDPPGATIRERNAGDYHTKALKKARRKLKKLEETYSYTADLMSEAEYYKELRRYEEGIREKQELELKYCDMLSRVEKWNPPTPDHEGFKQFMADQINKSIEFDCGTKYEVEAMRDLKLLTGKEWLEAKKADVLHDIKYHKEGREKEINLAKEANNWIRELKKSLK